MVCAWLLPIAQVSRGQRALMAAGYRLLLDNLVSPVPLIAVDLLWLAVAVHHSGLPKQRLNM
jgi:hypothetical protein